MDETPSFDTYEDLIDWTFRSSATVADAFDRLDQQTRVYEFLARSLDADDMDLTEQRAALARLKRRFELFHMQIAPRGWAMSPTMEKDLGFVGVAIALEKGLLTPHEADDWLGERLHDHPFTERLVEFLCMAPLRAIWKWAPVAGDAAVAMRQRLALPAALAWLAIFEGMWKDLQPLLGRERPRQAFSRGYALENLTEGLTFTRESLTAVHRVLVVESTEPFQEPLDRAPTNRHALVHGNVSGYVQLHHAVKAFTLVEATVEEAKKLLQVVDSKEIEPAPWR